MPEFLNQEWPRAELRFRAFWAREILDRCCIAVSGPRTSGAKGGPTPPRLPPPRTQEELREHWLNYERNLPLMAARFANTWYGGEAFPATTMCLGASVMAEYFGAKVEFRPETVWYHPVIEQLAGHNWPTDPTASQLRSATVLATRYYLEHCDGTWFVGMPELGSATDNLSLLRGMQNLVMDMIDIPEVVEKAIARLVQCWQSEHTMLYELTRAANAGGGCIPWMQCWAPGPCYQMSCDFSTVLSPELFRTFILPELTAYLEVAPYSVYHLDGPDEIKHLDAILEIPNLRAVQWTQGAGNGKKSDPRWIPLYRRIQSAGKCLVLPEVEPSEVEALLGQLSSRGLLIATRAANEVDGQALLKKVPGWTRDC